jgi:2-polyprenyl-3-methyl-5-hydroxy-6-metoxy-1,4-benzoquinol methylase
MPRISPPIPARPEGLEAVLDEFVFSAWDRDFLQTEAGKRGREVVLVERFQDALRFTVPWLSSYVDLSDARIAEIGCGSGSSTAALGLHSRSVHGFDIDRQAVRAAEARCRAYGLENVQVSAVEPESMLGSVLARSPDANVFLLYAVLEHLTYAERLETLSTLWRALPPGGHLVVVETPNRLAYLDSHSTDTEFFHLLPDELALPWVGHANREAFRIAMRDPLRAGPAAASMARIRYGIGVSYHEFVLGIGEPLEEVVVADGFSDEMLAFFHAGLDEKLLVEFFLAHPVKQPMGFARCVLNFVLRKPASDADRARARAFNMQRRQEVAARHAPTPAPAPREPSAHSPARVGLRALFRYYRERLRRR